MGRSGGGAKGEGGSGGFADLVGDVKPLKSGPSRRREAKPRETGSAEQATPAPAGFRFPDPDEPRLAAAPGVSNRVLRDLGRGEPDAEESIELHGLDREGARRHLARNFESAVARGMRCVVVSHGWGRGSAGEAVLRDALPGWLAKPPCAQWVLAFAPALPKHGGQGATYVLLRKRGQ